MRLVIDCRMRSNSATIAWVATAFAGTAVVAGTVLALSGADEHGTVLALKLTARMAFLLFWPAYVAGALALLPGAALAFPKRHARDFGLAFAAAMLVHAALIAWLCWIDAAPASGVFLFFGPPLAFIYILALASLPRLRQMLGHIGWRVLQVVGMSWVAYAFATDFLGEPLHGGARYLVGYLPFAAMSIIGPVLYAVSLLPPLRRLRRASP